jgi:hypothetical protein
MVNYLNPSGKNMAIYECDFFCLVLCVFFLWGDDVSEAVVIYTDNNAVRDALISCYANCNNTIAKKILVAIGRVGFESEKHLTPWYARTPTNSNFADGPALLMLSRLIELSAHQCDVEQCWDERMAQTKKWGKTGPSASSHVTKDENYVQFNLDCVLQPAVPNFIIV